MLSIPTAAEPTTGFDGRPGPSPCRCRSRRRRYSDPRGATDTDCRCGSSDRVTTIAPFRSLVTATLLVVAGTAGTAAAQAPRQELPIDPAVTIGELGNGLRYYVRSNSRPENRAELRLVVRAGSVLEEDDQRGLAHFLEHMAFNGTRNFGEQELVRYLESIGMRFGPDLNAYTSFDETVYMLTIPSDRADAMEAGFRILADWADGILLEPQEVERERGVVIEEWRGRLGAGSRVSDAQIPVLLGGSRYAERLPIGRVEILESFPPESLESFYRSWYRPDRMAVIAVGDFDPSEVERLIRTSFERVASPPTPPEHPDFAVPPHQETRFLGVSDPELTTTRVEVLRKLPARRVTTVGDQRDVFADRLYTSMLNARLAEITQKPNAPFIAASSGRGRFVGPLDVYSLVAIVPDGGVERGLGALLTEAERVARYGFTPAELERSKANLLRALERTYAERERTNSGVYANAYVSHFLNGSPIPGIAFEYDLALEQVPGISLEQINELGRDWAGEADRVVMVSGPQKDGVPLPGDDQLAAVLASIPELEIAPYQEVSNDAPLLASLPEATPVADEVRHAAVDVLEWRLPNGVRVLLKATDFRDDEVVLRAYQPGGLSLASDQDYLSASFATDVIGASGIGDFSAIDLQRKLAGKAVSVSPFIGELEQGLAGTASPRDLETLFQLAHLYFTAPRQDGEATAAMMEQLEALLANRDADPNAAFSDTLRVALSQGHPRVRPLTRERLWEVDLDFAYRFYRERFADAGGFTFVLVGNLDPEEVKALAERYLGSLPATSRTPSFRDDGVRPPGGVVEKIVRKGLEPRATTQLVFTGPFEYSRERAYAVRVLANILDMRLRDLLREELGGTYGAQVSGSVSRQPVDRYTFGIGFGSSPDRREELLLTVDGEIRRIREAGPTEDELATVREIHRRERETSLRQNGFWVAQIVGMDREGRPLEEILDFEALLSSVTAERVIEVARVVLDPARVVSVSLLPAAETAARP